MSDLTAPTKIVMGGSLIHSITSPREMAEHAQGKRDSAAALRVQVPVGTQGKSKIIEVPLTERDLLALNIAVSGALAFFHGVSVS